MHVTDAFISFYQFSAHHQTPLLMHSQPPDFFGLHSWILVHHKATLRNSHSHSHLQTTPSCQLTECAYVFRLSEEAGVRGWQRNDMQWIYFQELKMEAQKLKNLFNGKMEPTRSRHRLIRPWNTESGTVPTLDKVVERYTSQESLHKCIRKKSRWKKIIFSRAHVDEMIWYFTA